MKTGTCLICVHNNLQKHPQHARAGICHCELNPEKHVFNSLSHTCDKFKEMEDQAARIRKDWNDKRYTTATGHLSSGGALVSTPMTDARADYLKAKSERQRSAQKAIDSLKPAQLAWRSK